MGVPASSGDERAALGRPWRGSILLFAVIAVAIGWALALLRLQEDRALTLQESREQLRTLAKSFGLFVEAMVADGLGSASAGARGLNAGQDAAAAEQVLRGMLGGSEYLRALFVLRDSDIVVAGAAGERLSAAAQGWRTALQAAPGNSWVGMAELHSDSGGMSFPVAWRVRDADGVERWVGALIGIGTLERVYAELLRTKAWVTLATEAGLVLVRFPAASFPDNVNVDLWNTASFQQFIHMPVQNLTELEAPQPQSGRMSQFAIYRIKGLPIGTAAGRAVDDALAAWRERAVSQLLSDALASAFVIAMAMALQRLMNRRWQSLRQLAEARQAALQTRESLTRELLAAQEGERRRLAGELHDGVGQHLSLLRNRVVLLRRAGISEEAQPHAEALLDLTSEAIEELRDVSHNLRTIHLEELGLTSALRALVERVEMASELAVRARIEDADDVLTGETATHVYRIVQEALNNVLRHAQASHLWVEVIRDIAHVEIRVRDDGRGLPAEGEAGRRGLGLSSIAERCAILGAELTLTPNLPVGTSFVVRLNLAAAEGDGTSGAQDG